MLQRSSLDQVFQALADPTRRAIVERLFTSPASVSDLAAPFAMSLSAIGQHIHLLESFGLVHTAKIGRVRTVALVPGALAAAERWFTNHREQWERRFDRLGALLEEPEEKPKQPRRKA